MARFDRPAIPELPELEPGVTLLDADGAHGPLHALVADHLLVEGGTGYWIDCHGHATTHVLADVATSDRLLDRIEVARGFTPHQHHAIVETLFDRRDIDPGIVVAPAVDGQYRDACLHDTERPQFLLRTVARLAGLARRHDCPVLVTRAVDDAFSEPVSESAKHTVGCESTPLGPRFVGDGFETLVYPQDGGWVQTTLAFWKDVLTARQPLYGADAPMEARIYGAH